MITINNESGDSRATAKPFEYVLIQAWEDGANVKLHFPKVSVPKAHACAAHIFARRWGPHMPDYLELEDVNSPTNALVLMKSMQVYTPLSHVGMHSTSFHRPCRLASHACLSEHIFRKTSMRRQTTRSVK